MGVFTVAYFGRGCYIGQNIIMALFTVRVELHEPHDGDYNILHEAMKKRGFARAVQKKSGDWCDLPHGEYSIKGNYTTLQIYNKAKHAAVSVLKHPDKKKATKYFLLVTKSQGDRMVKLPPNTDASKR